MVASHRQVFFEISRKKCSIDKSISDRVWISFRKNQSFNIFDHPVVDLSQTQFLFFDLGNVLLKFDHDIAADQMSELANVSAAQAREIVFDSDLQHRYETGEISTSEFCDEFCERIGRKIDHQALVAAASNIFWMNRSIVPLINSLYFAKVPMGILSNTCQAHWSFICQHHSGLLQLFRHCVLSFEIKLAKPDQRIYEFAANKVELPSESIFFVDDRQENVDGARRTGWDAVRYHDTSELAMELAKRSIRFNF